MTLHRGFSTRSPPPGAASSPNPYAPILRSQHRHSCQPRCRLPPRSAATRRRLLPPGSPFGFPQSDLNYPVHSMRMPHLLPSHVGVTAVPGSAPIKGIPVSAHPKVAPSPPSVSDCNGYKDSRDRNRDDTFVTVRDRKVRISDGASIYALCRSWLRNGFSEETQPQHYDSMKSLPRPLPIPVTDPNLPKKKEDDDEEEDEGSVENLLPQDLLQRHIKRAKKVRARLREQRLKRIARYKTRLALLLPPPVEQFRNDTGAGN
ncbi:uncharacterized protein LOC117927644 [Vitis riparia]|uniref:uncharacterized protein LOC117927644 n=1 Tax=Vitis riparia TaxID=96939 RepID=UPI00155A637D|nr:uncharacterized protein LOC117927644 [Vitis riparia]